MSVRFILFFFVFTALSNSYGKPDYAKDQFISNIMKKDVKEQQEVIEKRILFALQKSIGLNLKSTLSYYFDPIAKFRDREKFVDLILLAKNISSASKARFVELCNDLKCSIWAANHLNERNFSLLKGAVYRLFQPENLQYLISEKAKVRIVLRKMMALGAKDDPNGDILFFSRYFGFYDVGLNYYKNNPAEIQRTRWSHLDYCVLLLLGQKMAKAYECLGKRNEPHFRLHKMSIKSLSNDYGPVDRKQFEQVKKEILAFKDNDSNMKITIYEFLMFREASSIQYDMFAPHLFGNHYFNGFMIQKIMQKMPNKPKAWLKKVEASYDSKYRDSFLSKVLKNQESSKPIVDHFGPNAPISRAINF